MSTPFNLEWLQPGAVVPVDIPTLCALVAELRRVNEREWVGLTDEDMEVLFLNEDGVRFARYIEAKLKEKNT